MPKGYSGMPGNINNIMKQAQKMQKKMADTQEELEKRIIETSSGGGAIKVVITGKKEIQSITISKDVIDPDDVEMLQDLIQTALNDAIKQADDMVSEEMSKITGGLNLPF